MKGVAGIRILENDNNRRGDLFGRLMADLFVALGYEQPRINIHKSGRELDLSSDHRLEPRRAIAECKATRDAVGGDEINKFVGVLDAESVGKRPVIGYFISLAGFKETAVEQERQGRKTKIVTLTGTQVVDELVQGRILITKERAAELAGRCCAALVQLVLEQGTELFAHSLGWIWAIYYSQGKARTHYVLIHSDGTPLASVLAAEIVSADRDCGGQLHTLTCLNPPPPHGSDNDPQVKAALAAYGQYLANECGFIQLDGLPADADVGSRRMRLENLFVPLHLDIKKLEKVRQPMGLVLAEHPRLALLAAPGGGKSTLLKRLAVAYMDPARRGEIADNLPQNNWLPLFFRCRELRHLARGSFAELLEALSQREPVRQQATVFRAYVDRALLAGRILLLVDGLDEISDPGDRAAFVCTMRTALQAYHGTAIVVTSREAGFRHVAAHLAPICTHATLSQFDPDDIARLSVAWHREVVGDSQKVRSDAQQLATAIVRNDRIRRLAVNPLLLTTLLLVKRWVGSLPTRRAILYGKAVEVLLMTWNTEGHEPIPEEEAMPQLCYVASAMMLQGIQKISRPRLAALLQEARDALPTELGYVKGTVDEFIHRVEDRSSLLMMTGHDVENGLLVEFFEFRHLTFQEFLTARAVVEGWHPDRKDNDTLVSVLQPHFGKEQWREVLPLAAVLGGKGTEPLMQLLTEEVRKCDPKLTTPGYPVLFGLANSLADEAAARPETIRAAIRELARLGTALHRMECASTLARGKYGADLREEAGRAFLEGNSNIGSAGDALVVAVRWQILESQDNEGYAVAMKRLLEMLISPSELSRCEGATGIGSLAAGLWSKEHQDKLEVCSDVLRKAGPLLVKMLEGTTAERCAAVFALESVSSCRVWTPLSLPLLLGRLFKLWRNDPNETVRNITARAIASQRLEPRAKVQLSEVLSLAELDDMLKEYPRLGSGYGRAAFLVIAWYFHALSDDGIRKHASELVKEPEAKQTAEELMALIDNPEKQQ